MAKILIKEQEHKIEIPILLTAVSGKIRVKNRSILNEYGTPVAVKRDGFALSNYIEWQIGYDVVKKETEKLAESSLPETEFVGANGKIKAAKNFNFPENYQNLLNNIDISKLD